MSGIAGNMQEKSAAARMLKQFSVPDLQKMIEHWVKSHNIDPAYKFMFFYKERWKIYNEIRPKDYEWD